MVAQHDDVDHAFRSPGEQFAVVFRILHHSLGDFTQPRVPKVLRSQNDAVMMTVCAGKILQVIIMIEIRVVWNSGRKYNLRFRNRPGCPIVADGISCDTLFLYR